MKITGKEKASLTIEKNDKPELTICQLNWGQLLNNVIVSKIFSELQKNGNIKKCDTRDIMINDMKLSKKNKISVKFKASLKIKIPGIKNNKYEARKDSLQIKDFYNYIVELFEDYAYELDTDIDNIKLELVELEIIEGKPLTKLRICCSDSDYFNDYIDTIKKYSMDDIEIKKNEGEYGYHANIYVESLDFLLEFVEDIKKLNSSNEPETHNGFIFSMIDKGYYNIEIYNGWIE